MSEIKKSLPAPEEIKNPKTQGLTIEEIRYQRAMLALQKEFCKEKMILEFEKIRRSSPFSKAYKPSNGSHLGRVGGIAGKLLGGFNYIDYAVIGFSIFNSGRKLFKLFKK